MSIFKTTSRFAALTEEIKKDNKKIELNIKNVESNIKNVESKCEDNKKMNNSFKKDSIQNDYGYKNQRNHYTNKFSKEQLEKIGREEKMKKDFEEKLKAAKFAKDMAIENFPTLQTSTFKNKIEQNNNISFLVKLNTKVIKEEEPEDKDLINLKPGWVIIKVDKNTGKTIIKPTQSTTYNNIFPEKTEKEYALDVFNALADLHEKRTNQYIEMWGYDEWEKMFKFPNYDYNYFDNLDTAYEEEMMQLIEEEYAEEL